MSTVFLGLAMLMALAVVVGLYVLAYAIFSLIYAIGRRADVREIHPIPRETKKSFKRTKTHYSENESLWDCCSSFLRGNFYVFNDEVVPYVGVVNVLKRLFLEQFTDALIDGEILRETGTW